MRVIFHDLEADEANQYLLSQLKETDRVFAPKQKLPVHCTGCYACWIKTPGECVIKDGYELAGACIGNASELCIISECVYGNFSPSVKMLMDRSISGIHPFLVERNGETHHQIRYSNSLFLRVYYYGDDLSDAEKECMEDRVKASGVNFNAVDVKVKYVEKGDFRL